MIKTENLSMVFTTEEVQTKALNEVTLHVEQGEFVAIMGPSGCGKSTTLYMICGLLEPSEGQIFFGEDDVTDLPPEERGVGLVFQNYALYPHMTVYDNIEVKQGEFVAIMGPSGCGKSTLLNILGTLDSPTSGKYFFNGKEIDKMGESQLTAFRKGNIGFVFQSFNLIDELTVFENVELPLVYLGCRKSERKRKVMEVLDRMNIAHRAGHFPQQLSGGQQQRVAIARAVVTDCPLILADEPTGNLDSTNGAEVMELLRELNGQGTTIVMVTHSERDASFARRIIHLLDGRVVS